MTRRERIIRQQIAKRPAPIVWYPYSTGVPPVQDTSQLVRIHRGITARLLDWLRA